ncbi:MAG: trigger factor [Atopobiaceae bacterium]
MKITVTTEKPSDDQLVATVTVDKKDVDSAINRAYKQIARQYNFQGFRRGHAPRPVIDSIVGREAVLAQATNDVINAAEPQMLEQLDVVPVKQVDYGKEPALVVEHNDYELKGTIEVVPPVELDSYDAPTINMPPEEATDAEIDQQIEQLLSYRTTLEEIDEDRPAEATDHVQCKVENVENMAQYAGDNRSFDLSSETLPQELRDAIVGMKKGDTKDVEYTRSHEHDGQTTEAKFAAKVTLNSIRKEVTPELTEDVIKKDFGFDSEEDLRKAIKDEIEADKKHSLPELKEDRLVEEIGKHLTLEKVPEDYTEKVFNEIANQFLTQLQRQNISLDLYLKARGINPDDFIADLRSQADERARQSLALDALAQHLGLEATDDDVKAEFDNAGVDDAAAAYKQFKDEGRLPAVRESIKRTKAVDWLVENAQVNVVDEIAQQRAAKDDSSEDAKDAQ